VKVVDPRGGHQRYVSAPASTGYPPVSMKGMPVAWTNRFAVRHHRRWLPPGSTTVSTPTPPRRDRSGLCPFERARRVCANGASGHSDCLLAQRQASHNVFVTESFLDELAATAR
jgi:hypothetical protein